MTLKEMELGQGSSLFTKIQLTVLIVLRLAIGWHFLYEGVAKLLKPGWSSAPYLDLSRWIFADLFQWIAASPAVVRVIDLLNIWGLILIGLGLILGCFTRIASLSGIILLLFYYVAHPPLIGLGFGQASEGSYLVVNKNLIEMIALAVTFFLPTGRVLGLDRLIARLREKRAAAPAVEAKAEAPAAPLQPAPASTGRRELLMSVATTPVLGAFAVAVLKKRGWDSYEEKFLQGKTDAVTGATMKSFNFASLKDLKGEVPKATIGNRQFSRLILGGNLMGGWAHARDLIYVSKLVKAYHSEEKIFETFYLAEKCGINTILTNPILCRQINEYWRRNIGKIQFISDCAGKDLFERIQVSIDGGAASCYVQGAVTERYIREGKLDEVGRAVDLIRKNGMPAGIGAHWLESIQACVEHGLEPDYWMKTLHPNNYWSARPEEKFADNNFCVKPEETAAFMRTLKQPWIAFKILAAGALHPKDGFRYAFENGADFICVGMYDFQVVEDVNIALDVLNGGLQRERPWST